MQMPSPTPLASPHRNRQSGFSLAELAIVLTIIGLLLGGLLPVLSTQMEIRKITETERALSELREALIGYAATHYASSTNKPYLPCPATSDNGLEGARGGTGNCNNAIGWIPWVDLGLGTNDAWNNRFRYAVEAKVSNSITGISLPTASYVSTLKVCRTQEAAICTTVIASNLPAVVLSHGANGYGGRSINLVDNPAPSSGDEIENANSSLQFVSGTVTPAGSANEFDDLVTWLPFNLLAGRLIAAGRLP